MSQDRINSFAAAGTLESEASFESIADSGFLDQRVAYSRLNRAFYRGDEAHNALMDAGPKRGLPDADVETLSTKLYPAGATALDTSENTVDTAKGTVAFWTFDIATIDGEKKLICGDAQDELVLDIIDIATMTYEGTQAISSASLPVTGNVWAPVAIHCDADTCYVVWRDMTAQNNRLQAYNLSDWVVKTGWPATGLALWNDSGTLHNISLISANDTLLAVPNPTQAVSASSDPAVDFVSKAAGTVSASGAGDQTSGTGPLRICSNGTYVFTAGGYSIDISSPTSGCGGTNWPRTVTGSVDVACLGGLVVWTANGSNIAYVGHQDNALIGTVTSADDSRCKDLGRLTTDGYYFWAFGIKTVGSTARTCLFKIDPHQLVGEDSSTAEAAGEELVTPLVIDNSGTHETAVDDNDPPVVFDGEAIWCLLDQDVDVFNRVRRINHR